MKKSWIGLSLLVSLGCGLSLASAPVAAKTTYLPKTLTSHVWYYTASGTEGGFHERTTLKKNKLYMHEQGKTYTWRFTKVKKHSKKVYYAKVHYDGGGHDQVKIKLIGKKEFLIISKYRLGTRYSKKPYAGTASFGAEVFKR